MPEYFIGTSGWHYEDWKGLFYPHDLPKSRWLKFYARHFPTVELNNSFYRLPSEKAFDNWRKSAPDGFVFAVKASRFITHIKRLREVEEPLHNLLERSDLLLDKLGPVLYQLPPNMKRSDDRLESFLSILPAGYRHVFEFRHESWFDDNVFKILRRHNAGWCIFDMPELRSPLIATADFAYVRFHGNDGLYLSSYSDKELAGWAKNIVDLGERLQAVYIYFNNDVAGYALDNARTLTGLLG
ncbi:MAG TPA: DUF72 domain-containing protein [Dehalococcoidia bacterium]|jgi:uncharacterized protein YecE (DUF72 family)